MSFRGLGVPNIFSLTCLPTAASPSGCRSRSAVNGPASAGQQPAGPKDRRGHEEHRDFARWEDDRRRLPRRASGPTNRGNLAGRDEIGSAGWVAGRSSRFGRVASSALRRMFRLTALSSSGEPMIRVGGYGRSLERQPRDGGPGFPGGGDTVASVVSADGKLIGGYDLKQDSNGPRNGRRGVVWQTDQSGWYICLAGQAKCSQPMMSGR